MELPEIKKITEALLFSTEESLPANKIKSVIGDVSLPAVKEAISELNKEYETQGRAFFIQEIAGGFQIRTRPDYREWIAKLNIQREETKLSNAAMEVLSVIAYKQPVIRAEIEAIRGVDSSAIVRALMEKGLVKMAGRSEELGHPILYGTAPKFLELLGLNSLQDLPKPVELK
jgi:segregation and condensation protein B